MQPGLRTTILKVSLGRGGEEKVEAIPLFKFNGINFLPRVGIRENILWLAVHKLDLNLFKQKKGISSGLNPRALLGS